jgi:hypothetical protein
VTFYILFLQVFRPKSAFKWNIYIGTAVTTVFYVVVTIILFHFTTLRPGQTFLENFQRFLHKKRSPVVDATLAMGYFNIISDVYILILPISAVYGLNLPTRRKIGLSLIFMAGILYASIFTVWSSEQLTSSGPFVVALSHKFIGMAPIIAGTRLGIPCRSHI